VQTLKTSEAAALLNVSPNTIRAWERRFGFPRPERSRGGHRFYVYAEVAALNDALRDGLSTSSAISVARAGLQPGVAPLVRALEQLETERADRVMEATLALRSLERAVEETLLPSVEAVRDRSGPMSVATAFAGRWAGGWLGRARRMAPIARDSCAAALIGSAALGETDPASPYVFALELFCTYDGGRVVVLPVHALGGLTGLLRSLRPAVAVMTAGGAPDAVVDRWARTVATACPQTRLVSYRRGPPGVGVTAVPASPSGARDVIRELAAHVTPR
jgi:DNA-binding transcriptional MerR regulator